MTGRRSGKRKRPIQVEKDANKWAEKRVIKLISEKKIKHKSSYNGFMYWKFQEGFKKLVELKLLENEGGKS